MRSLRRHARTSLLTVLACALMAGSAAAQIPPPTPAPPVNAAPPTSGPLKGMTLDQIDGALSTVEQISDVVGSWIGPKPPPRPEFNYSEARGFDMQLHQSMAAKLPRVNVLVDSRFMADAMPERMSNWLNQVRKRGGTVGECVIQPEGSRDLLFFLQIILRVVKAIDTWQLYRPAADYNALVLVNQQGRQVRNIIFVEKSQPQLTCPGGAAPMLVP